MSKIPWKKVSEGYLILLMIFGVLSIPLSLWSDEYRAFLAEYAGVLSINFVFVIIAIVILAQSGPKSKNGS